MKLYLRKIIPLIVILGVFALIFFQTGLFKVGKVDTKVIKASCVDESKLKLELNLNGKYIFFVKNDELLKKITSKYPCIKKISIKNKLSRDVAVTIEGRVPYIRIASFQSTFPIYNNLESTPSSSTAIIDWSLPNTGSGEFIADKEGTVFSQKEQMNLPILFITNEEIKLGSQLDQKLFKDIENIFSYLDSLNITKEDNPGRDNLYGQVYKLKKWENNLLIFSKPKLILASKRDILRQLGSLQLILQKAKIDGKEMEAVDLRFDKPVIIYSPQAGKN